MKPSTLASYLESIANVLRTTRGDSLPSISYQSAPRPMVTIGTNRLPVPAHGDSVAFLSSLFPEVSRTGGMDRDDLSQAHHDLQDMTTTAHNLRQMADRFVAERDEARRDLEALQRTVDRMRPVRDVAASQTVPPLPKAAPAPSGDFLSEVLEATEQARAPRPSPSFTVAPLMLGFPRNSQGKVLAASAYSLDTLRDRFTFRFTNPKDPTAGGYWLAKDSLSPAAQTLVEDLTRHGAFILSAVPTA